MRYPTEPYEMVKWAKCSSYFFLKLSSQCCKLKAIFIQIWQQQLWYSWSSDHPQCSLELQQELLSFQTLYRNPDTNFRMCFMKLCTLVIVPMTKIFFILTLKELKAHSYNHCTSETLFTGELLMNKNKNCMEEKLLHPSILWLMLLHN
jgi:hypothetical protein